MGDVFIRNPDGSLNFVDRVKYLIKSGGENIYPAEIESFIVSSKNSEAAVVKASNERWERFLLLLLHVAMSACQREKSMSYADKNWQVTSNLRNFASLSLKTSPEAPQGKSSAMN